MKHIRRLWIAYIVTMLLERVMAHALIHFDAAGHLLSAGLHTSIPTVATVAFFVVLRFVVWSALPVAVALMLLDAGRAIAARRNRSAAGGPTAIP